MNMVKKCSYCRTEVYSEGTLVKSGHVSGGIILPSMQVAENGMGPDIKKCWDEGICPSCLRPTLEDIHNFKEKGE